MRTGFALLLLSGGALLIYSAFLTPPDPRGVLTNLLAGRALGWGMDATGEYGAVGGNRLGPPNPNILPDNPQVRP